MEKHKIEIVDIVRKRPSFKEFMAEKHVIDRWLVCGIFTLGALAGSLFTVMWLMFGIG
jgi:hypothetical protein